MSGSRHRAAASKKIIRPWLARPGAESDHDKEVYLADPWLQDSPEHRRMVTLAGFVPGVKFGVEDIRKMKEEIMDNVRYSRLKFHIYEDLPFILLIYILFDILFLCIFNVIL